ncbi:hypothetical protein JD844_010085 [Phrynosoma platyrhinos]|uniref:Amidase domain-containing protein n=1 Tax=Phrynosoma platyrhinos TaxID=52577 RepID=A0ABQ7THR1_PHRPL|nr:hypothetical protein JD844_010085 [Phrynosoma platyrhinos]
MDNDYDEEGGLLLLSLRWAWGAAALLLAFYLGLVRRVTGALGTAFQLREPAGRRQGAGKRPPPPPPPTDAWSPRLSGFSLRLSVHLANTAFGQLFLVPLLMRINNFTILRYLDIGEDPTFMPVVAAEEKCDHSKSSNVSDILHKLIDKRQVVTDVKKGDMGMAESSTARYRGKEPLSLLDGIPVCLKEEIKVAPYYHRSGTAYLGTKPETEDATVTRKLREAGAIIIGVSNMHELGIGTTGCNPNRYHGTARNPYNPQHFTGGSSSGSAAAVASGLCPLALGTDGGGSVRIPASFCGIVGLKGTFGRISAYGSHPLSYSTVSLGRMEKSRDYERDEEFLEMSMMWREIAVPDNLTL